MNKLNIGFYGHSTSCWANSENNISFIDQIRLKFNANIVNIGVPQGSEERILFDLKKTKELDVAIIFHSIPKFVFLPSCRRDVGITNVPSRKAQYLWTEGNAEPVTQEKFEKVFFSYGKIKEVFETTEEYVNAMTCLKEYFYHPDLFSNRYYAAMLAIDNYLTNKKIKAYHIIFPKILDESHAWATPNSGIVDYETAVIPNTPGFPNNLSIENNIKIAEVLSNWINKEYGW
jgi:hypothetical protein